MAYQLKDTITKVAKAFIIVIFCFEYYFTISVDNAEFSINFNTRKTIKKWFNRIKYWSDYRSININVTPFPVSQYAGPIVIKTSNLLKLKNYFSRVVYQTFFITKFYFSKSIAEAARIFIFRFNL